MRKVLIAVIGAVLLSTGLSACVSSATDEDITVVNETIVVGKYIDKVFTGKVLMNKYYLSVVPNDKNFSNVNDYSVDKYYYDSCTEGDIAKFYSNGAVMCFVNNPADSSDGGGDKDTSNNSVEQSDSNDSSENTSTDKEGSF